MNTVENSKKIELDDATCETLPKRLRGRPTFQPGYVYHVTRGTNLPNIKRCGLIAQDKSEHHYPSKKNWFSPNLRQAYKLYGIDIVYSRYRFFSFFGGSKFSENYFQGIAVLRCRPAHLLALDYVVDRQLSLVGEKRVGPQTMELFIDGRWMWLNRVNFKWTLWPTLHKCTKFLRTRP